MHDLARNAEGRDRDFSVCAVREPVRTDGGQVVRRARAQRDVAAAQGLGEREGEGREVAALAVGHDADLGCVFEVRLGLWQGGKRLLRRWGERGERGGVQLPEADGVGVGVAE